jgi:hypothetical protein
MENDVVTVRREALHRALLQYYEYPAGEILGLADAYALAVHDEVCPCGGAGCEKRARLDALAGKEKQ